PLAGTHHALLRGNVPSVPSSAHGGKERYGGTAEEASHQVSASQGADRQDQDCGGHRDGVRQGHEGRRKATTAHDSSAWHIRGITASSGTGSPGQD
ncbi:unnamed protein product, partial [Ectocarpus sp. 12 AP-2014]